MTSSTLIADYIGVGLAADRPNPPPVTSPATAIYYETDTPGSFIWDGSAWQPLGGAGASFVGGISNIGNTAGTSGTNGTAIVLAGGNNITVSQATGAGGNTITISGANIPAQTNQTVGLYGIGNTTGESSSSTVDARSFSVSGAGIASVGLSAGSFIVSVPADKYNVLSASGNTDGTLTTFSTGTVVLAGGDNITLSQSSNTISIIGASGGGGAAQTISAWEPIPPQNLVTLNQGVGSIFFSPFILPANLTFQRLNIFVNAANTTAANTGQVGLTEFIGLYSRVNSDTKQITQVLSASYTAQVSYSSNASWGASWNGSTSTSAGVNLRSLYTGQLRINVGFSNSMSAGEWWLARMYSTTSAGSSVALSGYSIWHQSMSILPGLPGNSANNEAALQGGGIWTASSAALPTVLSLNDISTNNIRRLYFNMQNAGSL